ncbi:histidinol-phosphatase HisJ [Loigolactobacillus iwatensis]|uniref:histidinol-phosphatase HisJ n=1 Tax=Loigolactobacillus iwatensis TaxID=1267156 RepID=UPI000F7D9FB9|nr:histidinol-phosphatase HisJ [Loigolactobacillus iwatensis]
MLKKDGHSHTEFCPHGSGDDVELMIQKAIKFGFEEYSITEHAPLPPNFRQDYEGSADGIDEAALALSDLPAYFKKCQQMQAKYRDQIRINIGFELDFLPSQLTWTREFWREYGPKTTDNVLSIHFLKGKNNHYWCVDNTPAEFKTGLLENAVDDAQRLYGQYIDALITAVGTDLGVNAPHRLGHLTLIKKFQDYFALPSRFDQNNMRKIYQLFSLLRQRHFEIDLNTAGLFKPYCNEIYPYPELARLADTEGIPLVYGSDAHSVSAVGRAYHEVEQFLN